jgi:hypothetical protein
MEFDFTNAPYVYCETCEGVTEHGIWPIVIFNRVMRKCKWCFSIRATILPEMEMSE